MGWIERTGGGTSLRELLNETCCRPRRRVGRGYHVPRPRDPISGPPYSGRASFPAGLRSLRGPLRHHRRAGAAPGLRHRAGPHLPQGQNGRGGEHVVLPVCRAGYYAGRRRLVPGSSGCLVLPRGVHVRALPRGVRDPRHQVGQTRPLLPVREGPGFPEEVHPGAVRVDGVPRGRPGAGVQGARRVGARGGRDRLHLGRGSRLLVCLPVATQAEFLASPRAAGSEIRLGRARRQHPHLRVPQRR